MTDRVKLFPNISVSVAIGVRQPSEFKYLKDYGVDKFMLRFETSDETVYGSMVKGAKWQDRIEPIWKPLAGGCHLTRPIGSAIRRAPRP